MLSNSYLIKYQLPEYIRSDENYSKFIEFLQHYYDWMNSQFKQDVLPYADIDLTLDEFVFNFLKQFTPNIPNYTLTDRKKLIKIAKELYKVKGTPKSFVFLFRAVYDINVEIFETSSAVFKASHGKWEIPKSLQVKSTDTRWMSAGGYYVLGKTSKSIATIQYVKPFKNKMEIFISDIKNSFISGEMLTVVDNVRKEVGFLSYTVDETVTPPKLITSYLPLEAKLIGQISSVKIQPKKRGEFYNTGDPVVIVGGLNPEVDNPIGAVGTVGVVTTGAIQDVIVTPSKYYGYGFVRQDGLWTIEEPTEGYATVYVNKKVDTNAIIQISSINDSEGNLIVVEGLVVDTILYKLQTPLEADDYNFLGAQTSNLTSRLCDVFSVIDIPTGKLEYLNLINGGGGYRTLPEIILDSTYETDLCGITPPETLNKNIEIVTTDTIIDEENQNKSIVFSGTSEVPGASLKSLGVLGPIFIGNGGIGYRVNDIIKFSGGSGFGANAKVTEVASNGMILSTEYISDICPGSQAYTVTPGGIGYRNRDPNSNNNALPVLSVISSNTNAHGANLFVTSILSDGVELEITTDKIGAISTIVLTDRGEDYISTPNVSLRTINVSCEANSANIQYTFNRDYQDYIVFQGESVEEATFVSKFKKVSFIDTDEINSPEPYWEFLLYDYNKPPNPQLDLKISIPNANPPLNPPYLSMKLTNRYTEYNTVLRVDFPVPYKIYGNGRAKANAIFLNGLVIGEGYYINQDGHPSSFSVLQDNRYNNYTYVLTAEKSVSEYKPIVSKLLHPIGLNLIGNNKLYSKHNTEPKRTIELNKNCLFYSITGTESSYISVSNTSSSTNIITLVGGSPLEFLIGDNIKFNVGNVYVNSKILSNTSNITIEDNVIVYDQIALVNSTINSNSFKILTVSEEVSNNLELYGIPNIKPRKFLDYIFPRDNIVCGSSTYTVTHLSYANSEGSGYIYDSNGIRKSSNLEEGDRVYVSTTITSNIENAPIKVIKNISNITIEDNIIVHYTDVANVTSNTSSNSFVVLNMSDNLDLFYGTKNNYPRKFLDYISPGDTIVCDSINYTVTHLSVENSDGTCNIYYSTLFPPRKSSKGDTGDRIYVSGIINTDHVNKPIKVIKNINTNNVQIIRSLEI